jgi:hypothetical protein
MRTARLLNGVVVTTLVALGLRATAQVALPDGPNRELVSRTCSTCHDLGMLIGTARSREGWNGTIDDMTSYGMNITPAERALVLEYLATYLPSR